MKTYFQTFLSPGQILENEPMSRNTTFRTGGNADLLVLPENAEQVRECIKVCRERGYDFYIIGNGSNLLVSDKGFRGVIIKLYKNFSNIKVDGCKITAQAGAALSKIANEALKNSLKGFEFASGIPGTLGGAICMNAGAYGGEMKDVITSVTVLKDNEIIVLSNEEAGFEYRNSSVFKKNMIVLQAEIALEKGNPDEIKAYTEELKAKRIEKQPLEYPSAGSTFKRPANNFAGKLIQDAGLRGFSVGGAQVSEKHCGFVINRGSATTEDILKLIQEIKTKVYDKFNIQLCEEVKIIGDFS